MSGLLGFMAAGAAKGYSEGRGRDLAQKQEFDLKTALLDAQMDKELRLKEAGFAMEDKREAAERERNKGYMTGDDGAVLSTQEAANKAMQSGDLETAEKFNKSTPKRETFTLSEGQKVVDSGGKVIAEGNPKAEKFDVNEMIFLAASGDKKAQAFLDKMSAMDIKKAVAGRAPQRETETESRKRDFIDAYSDNPEYVKNGKLTSKGFDKFNKIESDEYQTVTEKPVIGFDGTNKLGKDGKPLMTTSVTRKEKVPQKPVGGLTRDKNGNYIFNR